MFLILNAVRNAGEAIEAIARSISNKIKILISKNSLRMRDQMRSKAPTSFSRLRSLTGMPSDETKASSGRLSFVVVLDVLFDDSGTGSGMTAVFSIWDISLTPQ